MPIFDLYSKRKRVVERSGEQDVYQYRNIPDKVINQIITILREAIGDFEGIWKIIINALEMEYGEPSILFFHRNDGLDSRRSCINFLKNHVDIDRRLDLIELSFRLIDGEIRQRRIINRFDIKLAPDQAIFELNYRLREGGVGYQYEKGVMIRMDSQFIHAEITKKALSLLSSEHFSGADEEFLAAHKHYREGDHKDAIVDAGASVESTMKCICDTLDWKYEKGAGASELLRVLRENRLFPDYLDKSFDQLLAVLKSGLPEIRNNEGSHGQGSIPKRAPTHVAAYALHLAATNIVFLVECMKDLQSSASK
jgi:AbiJ N-terminal domain 4